VDEEQGEADDATGEGSQSLWKLVMSSGVLASMCCLPSVVLVMFGLASVSTAAALSDTLYWGPFRPILYGFTLIFIGVGLTFHFRSQGICTLDEAKQQRTRIINTAMLVLIASLVTYLFFNYVILEFVGIAVGLPWEDGALWN
jgi:magnesium-transporting ATPase (P-type)